MAIVALVGAHGLVLRRAASHAALSGAVVAGAMALVVAKHPGAFVPLRAWWRRRRGSGV